MKTLSVKLPEALAARLTSESKLSRRSRSELVRQALQKMFTTGRETKRLTLADALEDLGGSVNGPADLSTNPAHLTGFGQ